MPEERRDSREQQPETPPIVEDDGLPRMEREPGESHGHREGDETMAEAPQADAGGERRMESSPEDLTRSHQRPLQRPREQVSREERESYVRLTVHHDNGRLTVVGAREVEGPLAVADALPAGFSWEVATGDRRISLGSIPDAGVIRSFANRDLPEPQRHHGFQEVTAFDFNVRIPRRELTPDLLPRLRISLHRLSRVPERTLSTAPLRQQLSDEELTEVGHLDGLRADGVAETARAELERVLQTRL
jgi:hypothetical protein